MATALPHLPDIERLSPRVIRVLGGNPGKFQLQGTNTYIIGQGPKRILIDSGQGFPAWAESLKKILTEESASISQALLTHWHHDHTSGVKDLLQISPEVKVYQNNLKDKNYTNIEDGQIFKADGATLKAFHCPGHAVDHMAFILDEEDAMFTADNVLGHGTAVFEDLATYLDSLARMHDQFSGRAYPGHGAVIDDGRAKIKEYISHRQERENQVLDVLKGEPASGEGWKSMEVVKIIYKDYPEALHVPAEGGVLQVLDKLVKDGRVQEHGQSMWSLSEKAAL